MSEGGSARHSTGFDPWLGHAIVSTFNGYLTGPLILDLTRSPIPYSRSFRVQLVQDHQAEDRPTNRCNARPND